MFTTEDNLKYMRKVPDWLGDGTFRVAPDIFRQLFTFHIIYFGRILPLVYFLLPVKTYETYFKMFQMVKAAVGVSPNSISCDYELAILKAIKAVFKKTEISGCYFHFTQNLFKNLSKNKLFTNYTSKSDSSVRKSFNLLKTLAFVPIDEKSSTAFKPMLVYFDKYYIGKLKKGSKSIRNEPVFAISSWNVYDRVLNDLPRTNNAVEAWHKAFANDINDHPLSFKLIEFFRKEQDSTEVKIGQINLGEKYERSKASIKKDEAIKFVAENYDSSNKLKYMENMSLALFKKLDL